MKQKQIFQWDKSSPGLFQLQEPMMPLARDWKPEGAEGKVACGTA